MKRLLLVGVVGLFLAVSWVGPRFALAAGSTPDEVTTNCMILATDEMCPKKVLKECILMGNHCLKFIADEQDPDSPHRDVCERKLVASTTCVASCATTRPIYPCPASDEGDEAGIFAVTRRSLR